MSQIPIGSFLKNVSISNVMFNYVSPYISQNGIKLFLNNSNIKTYLYSNFNNSNSDVSSLNISSTITNTLLLKGNNSGTIYIDSMDIYFSYLVPSLATNVPVITNSPTTNIVEPYIFNVSQNEGWNINGTTSITIPVGKINQNCNILSIISKPTIFINSFQYRITGGATPTPTYLMLYTKIKFGTLWECDMSIFRPTLITDGNTYNNNYLISSTSTSKGCTYIPSGTDISLVVNLSVANQYANINNINITVYVFQDYLCTSFFDISPATLPPFPLFSPEYISLSDPSYNIIFPKAIASDGNNLWIGNWSSTTVNSNIVNRININTLSSSILTYPYFNFNSVSGMVFDSVNKYIWTTNWGTNTVIGFDVNNPYIGIQTLSSGYFFDNPFQIIFDGTNIWVGNYNNDTITTFNVSQLKTVGITDIKILSNYTNTTPPINTGYNFKKIQGMAYDGENIWVTNAPNYTLTSFNAKNPDNNIKNINVNKPYLLGFDGTNIWSSSNVTNTVTIFNPKDPYNTMKTITNFTSPGRFCYDGKNTMWIGSTITNSYLIGVNINNTDDIKYINTQSYGLQNVFDMVYANNTLWITPYPVASNPIIVGFKV